MWGFGLAEVPERPDGSAVRCRMDLGARVRRQVVPVSVLAEEREEPVPAAPSAGAMVGDLSVRRVKLRFPCAALLRSP